MLNLLRASVGKRQDSEEGEVAKRLLVYNSENLTASQAKRTEGEDSKRILIKINRNENLEKFRKNWSKPQKKKVFATKVAQKVISFIL